ncbi:MAG: IS66 family transposase [Methanosarcina sp.]
MKTNNNPFTDQQLNTLNNEELLSLCKILMAHNKELNNRLDYMIEQINLANHHKFGKSSEKGGCADDCEQVSFCFNEAEIEVANSSQSPTTKEEEFDEIVVTSHRRKKKKGKKETDLANFPVITIEHKLPEDEQICNECGEELKVVTTESYKLLRFVPEHFEVEEHVVYVYACKDNSCGKMERAEKEPTLLRGSIATPSIVAAIINAKYVNGMPIARLEKEFERNDVYLSRQTMSNWVIRCSEEYFSLLYDCLKVHLLQCKYAQADETIVQVLHEEGRKATSNSYMWVYRTSERSSTNSIILFDYQETRAGYHPKEFLSGYEGYLTTDGYQAYHNLGDDIIITGCLAHARRKFHDCIKTLPEKQREGTVANEAIKRIAMLYQIETLLKEKIAKERYEERQKQSKPLLDAFFEWLKTIEPAVSNNSMLGKAITYSLNQEKYLRNYLIDGNIPIDNNASERAIKPFVIGRKAWMFCNSPNGAKASAIIYSIVETAKAHRLKPYHYLRYVLEVIPKHMNDTTLEFVEDLLPWSDKIPNE